jgi:hypothetical protein
MIKYRPHRGGLADSMAEAREFATIDEMKEYIYKIWNDKPGKEWFSIEDIVIGKSIGNDDRIGWKNVRHVCIKRFGNEDYIEKYGCPQCIAWCGE